MADWKLAFLNTIPGLKKAFTWCSLNVLFGLLPLLLLLMLASMTIDPKEADAYKERIAHSTFRECAVMFFFCAIMGAALVDFVLSKVRPATNLTSFAINVSPLGMLILVTVLFVGGNHGDPARINFDLYGQFQTVIIVFSSLYCLIVKTYLYLKEKEVS